MSEADQEPQVVEQQGEAQAEAEQQQQKQEDDSTAAAGGGSEPQASTDAEPQPQGTEAAEQAQSGEGDGEGETKEGEAEAAGEGGEEGEPAAAEGDTQEEIVPEPQEEVDRYKAGGCRFNYRQHRRGFLALAEMASCWSAAVIGTARVVNVFIARAASVIIYTPALRFHNPCFVFIKEKEF